MIDTGIPLTLLAALSFPPDNFGDALIVTIVFGAIGILLTLGAFKLLDLLTPGNLQEEILQKNNIAAAILSGAFVVGIAIVIAAVVG